MRFAIGIDLGGTELRTALVDANGKVYTEASERTDALGGPEAVVDQMVRLVGQLDLGGAAVEGIGVGSPGPLNAVRGIVTGPPTLSGWYDFPLRDRLSDLLKLPVTLDNDGHAAALGEWVFGAARGLSHFVYITVSTGIGGGVVVDGRMLRGRGGLAGHVGHMAISGEDIRCSCGRRGCFEALASGTALGRRAREFVADNPSSAMLRHARGEPVTAYHVGLAARDGDPEALSLIDDEAGLLARGVTNLIHLYSPEMVIIGGGLSALYDLMAERLHQQVRNELLPAFHDVRIAPAALGSRAGVIGAASLRLAPNGASHHKDRNP